MLSSAGAHLFWADEDQARELIKAGKVETLATKQRIHALRVRGDRTVDIDRCRPRPARYSHCRETGDNPQGCWTLVRLPRSTFDLYVSIIDELAA